MPSPAPTESGDGEDLVDDRSGAGHDYGSDEDELGSLDSNDSTLRSVSFRSLRDTNHLERGISIVWPTDPTGAELELSTLLEPDELAPLFAGAQWAGTRVWHAAIRGMRYMEEEHGDAMAAGASLLELGCGLGVPGMVWHRLGGTAVLTDQESIMSQLRGNLASNFGGSLASGDGGGGGGGGPTIDTQPLSWSRDEVRRLLRDTGRPGGFDYVLNCDCVYEPLYGKSWELLVEVVDELLRINPGCVVVSSVERRTADGIDDFVDRMRQCVAVAGVERVLKDQERKLEIFVTRGHVDQ
jgi:predicted nicotinamide N-methyase